MPVTHAEWHQELETFKGDIVVVDMWATWCIPCVERFPRMVEMYEKYHPEGVTFVSMCLDDRDDVQAVEGARQFLVEQNATFPNYLMDENIVDAFEKLDLLGIPAVFIYDRRGELRYRLTGDDPNNQFSDRDVEEA
ncbi:TlpA family protein disulfide reductase, partial [Acidobacteria bacterium AH-259-O06]|nr:TlpA family protein disulfide reductase [Acidobacteria bacterium AH-259-O06]